MLIRLRQQGVVCCSNCMAIFLFLCLIAMAQGGPDDSVAAPAAAAVQQPLKPEDYFGVYRSDDGAEAKLYQPGGEQAWTMSYVRKGEDPMVLVMEGDPSSLRPIGLDVTVSFNGKPLNVVGDPSGLYAKGASSDKLMECLASDGGTEIAFDGKAVSGEESPESMEAAMTVGDIAQLWKRMQHARVHVADRRLRIIPAN